MKKIVLTALFALAFTATASAEPPKEYPLVAAEIAKGPSDPSLEVFRATLGEIARKKDAEALRKLVAGSFFWERDFGGGFEKKKSAFINFATALSLNADDGSGWQLLAKFVAQVPGPHEKKKGVFCGPPAPKYNEKEFEKLLKDTDTEVFDWGYPAHGNVIAREKGEAGSPEVAKLSAHFVYVDLAARGSDFDYKNGWSPVVTHDGKKAFVAPGELLTPLDPRLCFAKRDGKWRIAGYIGGGD
ncbi:MAG: hypothetical protein KF807_03355 [Xanthobacteraceae bacterium]|nr:hypothetical protein [Xanthobacteraceae bacterium]